MSPISSPEALAEELQGKLAAAPVRNTFLHFDEAEDSTPTGCSSGPGTPQQRAQRSVTAPADCTWSSEEEWPCERRVERLATFDEFDGSPPAGRSPCRGAGTDLVAEVLADTTGVCEAGGAYAVTHMMDGSMGFVSPFPYGTFFAGYDVAGNMVPAMHCGYPLHQYQVLYPEYLVPSLPQLGSPSSKDESLTVGWTSSEGSCAAPDAAGRPPAEPRGSKAEGKAKAALEPSKAKSPAKAAGGKAAARAAEPTTVMLKNLPNNYTRTMLLELIDLEGFQGKYDFLYLPIDFRTHAALGYAFVNFVLPADAASFHRRMDGFSRWALPSNKVCCVGWSHPHQGLESNVQRYRNSPLMHDAVPDDYRPVIFSAGERLPFPPPTKKVKPPRQGTERMLV